LYDPIKHFPADSEELQVLLFQWLRAHVQGVPVALQLGPMAIKVEISEAVSLVVGSV
jgi:hypothetical protein